MVHAVSALPAEINSLTAAALAEGHNHVSRLVEEFASGVNRFDGPGEAFFTATVDGRLAAVGGVNRDPYDAYQAAGRVRRVYVHPDARRCGVASALMGHIEAHARAHFERLNLFTSSAEAALFYLQRGYVDVVGVHKISHRKNLSPPAHRDRQRTDA